MSANPRNSAAFSLRLPESERDLLAALAKHRNTTVSNLAREFVVDGIRAALDPAEITRRIDQEKERLLRIAEEMRSSVEKKVPASEPVAERPQTPVTDELPASGSTTAPKVDSEVYTEATPQDGSEPTTEVATGG